MNSNDKKKVCFGFDLKKWVGFKKLHCTFLSWFLSIQIFHDKLFNEAITYYKVDDKKC